ncbi:RIB43A-like with coiled-coils protein 2 isoform X2 [Tachypleus tridentatus]
MVYNDCLATFLQNYKKEEIKELNKQLNRFRLIHQCPEGRKEFDLSDPQQIRREKPLRDDGNISGAQKFEGEDLQFKERLKQQRQAVQDWLSQQIMEKKAELENEIKEKELWELKMLELDHKAQELQQLQKEYKKSMEKATRDYNIALAQEQAQLRNQIKQKEHNENYKELHNSFYGDFLTENPQTARSSFGPHRVIPNRWKGMSPEQKEEVRKGQLEQMEEKMRQINIEANFEKDWQHIWLAQGKHQQLYDHIALRQKRNELMNLQEENKRLAEEQKAREKYQNHVVYKNAVTGDYFLQFNTTSR